MAVRFSAIDKKIHEEVLNPERLVADLPELKDVYEGAAKLRELHSEINNTGKFQRANGFLGDRSMQRVAHMDMTHWLAMEQIHIANCNCGRDIGGKGGHKEWFYEWLKQPGISNLDVRGKVII